MINEEDLVNILMIDSLKETVKHYGLEGTLEAIDRVYPKNSKVHMKMKETFLKHFLKNNETFF